MTEVEEKTEFKFEELSDKAKEHAIQTYATPDYDWWEDTYVHYKTDPEIIGKGFVIEDITFSGFHRQGSGACWVGAVQVPEYLIAHWTEPERVFKAEIMRALIYNGDVEARIRIGTRGYYSNSGTMYIPDSWDAWIPEEEGDRSIVSPGKLFDGADVLTLYEAFGGSAAREDLEEEILQACKDLADKIYEDLESEYEGYFEEESFAAHCFANNYVFDENGKLI